MPAIGSSSSSTPRPERQRHGELELPMLAVRQVAAAHVGERRQPDPLENAAAGLAQRSRRGGRRRRTGTRSRCRACTASATLSSALNPGSSVRDLERAAEAQPALARHVGRRVMSWPSKRMVPAVGCELAGELRDQRRLAGAVRTDDARAPRRRRRSARRRRSPSARRMPSTARPFEQGGHAFSSLPPTRPQSPRRAKTDDQRPGSARGSASSARSSRTSSCSSPSSANAPDDRAVQRSGDRRG